MAKEAASADEPAVLSKKELGQLMAMVTSLQERTDGDDALMKELGLLRKQVVDAQNGSAGELAQMRVLVEGVASSATSMNETVKKLTHVRAELDDEGIARIERRVIEIMQAEVPNMANAIGDSFLRSVGPGITKVASGSIGEVIHEIRGAKPRGQGFALALGAISAAGVAALVWYHWTAHQNATPEKFTVEGAEGTVVKDAQGREIGRIAAPAHA